MARTRDMLVGDQAGLIIPSYVVAETKGNPARYTTRLFVQTTLPAIAGGANLAVGKLALTFPAGRIIIEASDIALAIKQTQGNITADTPDIGLGTTIASGVNALLSANAAFENVHTGQTAADCDGTVTSNTVGTQLVIEAGDAHTLYINVADGWAASGDTAALLRGEAQIVWWKAAS